MNEVKTKTLGWASFWYANCISRPWCGDPIPMQQLTQRIPQTRVSRFEMTKVIVGLAALTVALVWTPGAMAQPAPKLAETVTVPDLAGMDYEQAAIKLRPLGLHPMALHDTPNTDPAKAKRVASQEPRPGARVHKGNQVVLHMYRGNPVASVPNVVGMDRDSAAASLRRAGFVYDRDSGSGRAYLPEMEPTNDPAMNGKVLRQIPSAGTTLAKGSVIRLIVGKANHYRVPNVVGMTEREAIDMLMKAGFKPQKSGPTVPTDAASKKINTVARQDPAAGFESATHIHVKFWLYSWNRH